MMHGVQKPDSSFHQRTMFLTVIFFVSIICYVYAKLSCGFNKSPLCLVGKTAIVTGGNSGIGYEICLDLASRGCKVIIADKVDSTESRKKIIQCTKNPNIISKKLDLSSFKSIREFATDINKTEDRLDILVNNAGIGGSSVLSTEDGLNPIMQINYFGPFLLTHLLVDLLKKSSPSRIVFTSSVLAFYGKLDPETFTFSEKCGTTRCATKYYANSKLATIMASDILAEKLKNFGVTSNSLHPGIIWTNIYNTVEQMDSVLSLTIRILAFIFGKTVREGAQTALYLSTSEDVEHTSGKYFWDCRQFIKPPSATNLELRKKIWELSEQCVKLSEDEKL